MASTNLKRLLGQVPAAAALYNTMRPDRPRTRYNLEQLGAHLPDAVREVRPFAESARPGKRVLLFATLHYWIEQATILGLALRGLGHDVTIAYLPYSDWRKEINSFDLQRQDLYTRRILGPLAGLVRLVPLLGVRPAERLPDSLLDAIEASATFDAMYSVQAEEVDRGSRLFQLRLDRNRFACQTAISVLESEKPQVVLIPNGLVTEMAIFYQAARHLGIQAITYEFNDQREEIWLAQNEVVMRQNTDALWEARSSCRLTASERERIASLEEARSSARTFGKGTRLWQDVPAEGSGRLRRRLGLDSRPVVLLATNVLGDSLTLGRHVFASSMAEWIDRTVRFFAGRLDVQLVIRVHPGERLIKGPSMARVIKGAAPEQPEHIHVIGPADTTNTYDIMEIADLGLAYTTTVGMEMAMRGVPVILAGETHYRSRGFTLEPSSWDEYFAMLNDILLNPRGHRLSANQVETAWKYAYRFFFDYPFAFPWRLMHFWDDMRVWPLRRVLSQEGQAEFGRTFSYLAGEKIEW